MSVSCETVKRLVGLFDAKNGRSRVRLVLMLFESGQFCTGLLE